MKRRLRHPAARLGLALAAAVAALPVAGMPLAREPCDADPPRNGAPADAGTESRAIWLDARRAAWPGVRAEGRFRLYYSPRGAVVARPGAAVTGADGSLALDEFRGQLPAPVAERFRYVPPGVRLAVRDADVARLRDLHRGDLVLVRESAGRVLDATRLQGAGALDDLYADAARAALGVTVSRGATRFALWAPTARSVSLCRYPSGTAPAIAREPLARDPRTGVWSTSRPADLSGSYYLYLVEVFVPGVGRVLNRVTDPYSVSLTTDSARSYVADLDAAALKPPGWDASPRPPAAVAATDLVIYELHVRDFSVADRSVPAAHRGKYLAFTDAESAGMRHLRALAAAGVTDVHLLPVFDFATVPERGCLEPRIAGGGDSEQPAAAIRAVAARDCYNWGYEPLHFGAPEGSYATDAADAARRIIEFRAMVEALHAAGLRVGMDVVYNHTAASGQQPLSILDRIVPGYYHRLDARGTVERSTCCANTATEHLLMAKLMTDTVVRFARDYRVDSFRFDLMGHQPRAAMTALRARVEAEAGRPVPLIGEGWNFGEVADGARFVQASQASLGGSGIATFSDRARDALRGGAPGDHGLALRARQGYLNGLGYDPNEVAAPASAADLLQAADLVRAGLAGTLRNYRIESASGATIALAALDYRGAPAGYAEAPGEVVNYVENHDNQTLFDAGVLKLPVATSRADRARVQALGAAFVAFSQGIAYLHAGGEILRSKSLDGNSFDSGDWFNEIDWTLAANGYARGLPPGADAGQDWPVMRPLLADVSLAPAAEDIRWTRDAVLDLLRIRASSTLFRLRSANEVEQRLHFFNTGPDQIPTVVVGHLDGAGYPGAEFSELVYLVNVDKVAHDVTVAALRGRPFVLHPVHRASGAADRRAAREARYEPATGLFSVPARTAVVYVAAPR